MLIDYISSTMNEIDFNTLFKKKGVMPGQQAQKYNRLMVEGLGKNKVKVHVISCRPITFNITNKKYFPSVQNQEENIIWDYPSVLNIPFFKIIWQMFNVYRTVNKDAQKAGSVVVCDVLNASAAYVAVLAAKKNKIPCIGIVTDFPDMMGGNPKQTYVKLVYKVIKNCTGYIFLTEQMNDRINPTNKPYVIIEGLCDANMKDRQNISSTAQKIRQCIYAGFLDERYGVKTMVDGFIQANIPNTELHLYGSGPYVAELEQVVKVHPNIIYHGAVLNQEVVKAELEATLLVNPRPTKAEFTKYSFPSKNMEYMATGTPVLTTNLPGMPTEYQPYVYLIEKEDVPGVANAFKRVLSLPPEELKQKGLAAKQFVLEKKNNIVQAQKVVKLVEKQLGNK